MTALEGGAGLNAGWLFLGGLFLAGLVLVQPRGAGGRQ